MSKVSQKAIMAFAALVAAAALTTPASPASADSCSAPVFPFATTFTCVLPANSVHHFIHVSAGSGIRVEAVDRVTLVTVYYNDGGIWGTSATVTGLYGTEYYLVGSNGVGSMHLSNS